MPTIAEAKTAILRAFREFRRYTGDGLPAEPISAPLPVGDPQSGVNNPNKAIIRNAFGLAFDALQEIADDIAAGAVPDNGVTTAKLIDSAVTRPKLLPAVAKSVSINVYEFGALGNGVNDTAAVQAAIDYLPSSGGELLFPGGGTYKLGQVNVAKPLNIKGAAREGASVIKPLAATGDLFNVTGVAFTARDLQFSSDVVRTTGATIKVTGPGRGSIRDCMMEKHFQGIVLDGAFAFVLDGVNFFDATPSATAVGSCNISLGPTQYTPSISINNCKANQNNESLQPSFGIVMGYVDIINMTGVDMIKQGTNLSIRPSAGQFAHGVYGANCCFDSGLIAMAITPSGGDVRQCGFTTSWFSGSQQSGIVVDPSGSAIVAGVGIANSDIISNGKGGAGHGIALIGPNVSKLSVTDGCRISDNPNNGIDVSGGATELIIVNNFVGQVGNLGGNGQTGLVFAGAMDYSVVTGNNVGGNGTAGLFNVATGTHNVIANNPGA
ncbi:right-handed parallel beta-helix repeat-containing protein [Devosia submarina]|uniref:right-handed parallel beta-helix repeat-containing protein n=1 Tax=Devosia submarina TaxID=1173082 RepID=UPI000D3ADA04|nr:right-handed parallel beta-helix repeat-containing protein [Devosia submarina]